MPGFARLQESYDIVIVGGGHAGLHAALKAGLLHHTAAVLDRGPKYSRSYYAPRMVNIPGFPEAISGHALLDKQVAALKLVESRVGYFSPARAHHARRTATGYEVEFDWLGQRQVARGRALVLAMGVVDRMPELQGKIDPIFPWANLGLVHFCLFCDAYDMAGHSVAVLGHTRYAALSALDLLPFGPTSLEVLTDGRPFLAEAEPEERARLTEALAAGHVQVRDGAIAGYEGLRERKFGVVFADGSRASYERGFSALEWYDMHAEIPTSLGAKFDPEGFVTTDEDCRVLSAADGTPLPGLYCIGDQRNGWNQIPEAWATAERAIIHAYGYYL